jgi:hypothetical protein
MKRTAFRRQAALALAIVAMAAGSVPAGAADPAKAGRPIVGTDRLAEPANPAPLEGSRKRFLKVDPSTRPAPLAAKPDRAGPIIEPLSLRGHRDSPPSTTQPLKPGRVVKPASGG